LSESKSFISAHGKTISELEKVVNALDADPEQFDALEEQYQQADAQLQQLKAQIFALSDLVERRHHFAYSDSVDMLSQSSELSEQLKAKLVQAESTSANWSIQSGIGIAEELASGETGNGSRV